MKEVIYYKSGLVNLLLFVILLVNLTSVNISRAEDSLDVVTPLVRTVDLDIGEIVQVELRDGSTAEVELLDVERITDSVMDAVREVNVTVRVNGEQIIIKSGNYHLPVSAGGIQIDSPVTLDYLERANSDWWGLEKDARLRLWPDGSPYIWPGTFVYPVNQKWMASLTQFSNEPVFGSPRPNGEIYYHAGLDFGGAEDMVAIFAATDGIIVSLGDDVLPDEPEDNPIRERYDVVYIRDARGWYYRYSHFDSISSDLQPGQRVVAGQKLGMLGKEGGSGGWSHLHFHIESKQPSGKWGVQESYAFMLQAYIRQFDPELLAVARPYKVVMAGESTTLSGANSWAKQEIQSYEWTLSDGSSRSGMEVDMTYEHPGTYSEIVKVTDIEGNYDYDFATVVVFKDNNSIKRPPRIHAAFYPTRGIEPGDKVYFQVRARETTDGYDVWDFDDGSEPVAVKSNIDEGNHAKVGYSIISHRFEEPGDYIVKVTRETPGGTATTHLYVKIETP